MAGLAQELSAAQAAQLAALEEEVVKNVEEAVKAKVDELMATEEIQKKVQVRILGRRRWYHRQGSSGMDWVMNSVKADHGRPICGVLALRYGVCGFAGTIERGASKAGGECDRSAGE